MVSAKSSSVSNFPLYANSRNLAIKYLFGHFLSVIILWSPFGGWKRIWLIVYGNIIPNSLWAVPFLLLTSKVNFLMPPMRTIMWSSSGNRFASRCLSPSLAYIISSTRFTTILSTIAPRYSYHHAQTYAPISWTSRPQTMDAFGWNPILAPLHLSPLWLLQRHAKNEIAG